MIILLSKNKKKKTTDFIKEGLPKVTACKNNVT